MALANRQVDLETELSEIRNKIGHLDEVMKHLAPLSGFADDSAESISGLGITDSVRVILRTSGRRMSAQDVRRALEEKGFDLSGLTVPMASIYKVLSRLEESGEFEREKEDGRVFFKWKAPVITDEDIPF